MFFFFTDWEKEEERALIISNRVGVIHYTRELVLHCSIFSSLWDCCSTQGVKCKNFPESELPCDHWSGRGHYTTLMYTALYTTLLYATLYTIVRYTDVNYVVYYTDVHYVVHLTNVHYIKHYAVHYIAHFTALMYTSLYTTLHTSLHWCTLHFTRHYTI